MSSSGYQHRRIHHAEKVYVSGDVHTNTIEGFWSLVKRGLDGVYHAVSAKHLQGYLNDRSTWVLKLSSVIPIFDGLCRRDQSTVSPMHGEPVAENIEMPSRARNPCFKLHSECL